jgi:hypothetical protein
MPNVATVVLTVNAAGALPSTNAAYAKTNLTLTDSAGNVQTQSVNGTETPSWASVFNNVASGNGVVVAQPIDTAGANIGASLSQGFDETGPVQAVYPAPLTITVMAS